MVMLWSIQYSEDKKYNLLTLREINKRWAARKHINYEPMVPALRQKIRLSTYRLFKAS